MDYLSTSSSHHEFGNKSSEEILKEQEEENIERRNFNVTKFVFLDRSINLFLNIRW